MAIKKILLNILGEKKYLSLLAGTFQRIYPTGWLGKEYQDYTWTYDIEEVQTNKLFQVDFIVQRDSGGKPVVSKMSILLFRPASPAGSLDGATTK